MNKKLGILPEWENSETTGTQIQTTHGAGNAPKIYPKVSVGPR